MAVQHMSDDQRDKGPAASARQTVLDQHVELRRLLEMGLAQAHVAVNGDDAPGNEPLRGLVAMVRDVFVRHLADEEALILPILENDLPLGPLRAARLRQEHFEQRADLDALCEWPEDASDDELAVRFEALGRNLLNDITHEERELLTPEIIRDDCVVIDQLGG